MMELAEQPIYTSLSKWTTFREAMSQPALWRSWAKDLAVPCRCSLEMGPISGLR